MSYGKYERDSRSEYFLNLFNQASFLSTPIPEGKLVLLLGKHFSLEVQRGLVTLGLKTFNEIDEYLRNIENTYSHASEAVRSRDVPNDTGSSGEWRRGNRRGTDANLRHMQATRFNEDFEYCESDADSDTKSFCKSPLIRGSVLDMPTDILIDSGSEISAVSESFFHSKNDVKDIPILPVTNVAIKVAVGGKQYRVRRQVLLPIGISDANIEIHVKCFVIPGLNRDVLLGIFYIFRGNRTYRWDPF